MFHVSPEHYWMACLVGFDSTTAAKRMFPGLWSNHLCHLFVQTEQNSKIRSIHQTSLAIAWKIFPASRACMYHMLARACCHRFPHRCTEPAYTYFWWLAVKGGFLQKGLNELVTIKVTASTAGAVYHAKIRDELSCPCESDENIFILFCLFISASFAFCWLRGGPIVI